MTGPVGSSRLTVSGPSGSGARAVVEAARARHPIAVELATLCSLAVRVEPALLRRLRLLLPGADVAAEADLWSSGLLCGASPLGIALDAAVAAELRRDLQSPRWDERRDRARVIVAASHGIGTHWSLRLEEELHWLAVTGAPAARSEELLLGAVGRLLIEAVDAKRTGIARWLLAALTRLPGPPSDAATAARAAAGLQLDRAVPDDDAVGADRWLPWLLSATRTPAEAVRVAFQPGVLHVEPPAGAAAEIINVPATDPLVVDLEWLDGRAVRAVRVRFAPGEHVAQLVTADRVRLSTLAGERYDVRLPRSAARSGGLDFAAERARHRPCLARDRLLDEIEEQERAWWTVLSGPAGIGKTVLACAAADRLERAGRVVVQHFYGVDPAWDEPRIVAASIEAQLRAALPEAPWPGDEVGDVEKALSRAAAFGARVVALIDAVPGDSIEGTRNGMFLGPWPSRPPSGVRFLATTRYGGGVRAWLEAGDPVALLDLGSDDSTTDVCDEILYSNAPALRAAFGTDLDTLGGPRSYPTVPHGPEIGGLAGENPGRLAGIVAWLLKQPVGTASLSRLPRSLTIDLADTWAALEARFGVPVLSRWLTCLAVARPGFSVDDLRRLASEPPSGEGIGSDVLAAAVERGVVYVDRNLTVQVDPSLAAAVVERFGPNALSMGHHQHVLALLSGEAMHQPGAYAIAHAAEHALGAGLPVAELGFVRSGAFWHRRAVDGGVAAVIADLRMLLARTPDPVVTTLLHGAERLEAVAAQRPDRFVELLVNELRIPENEELVTSLVADTWPIGFTYRSLVRVGGREPQLRRTISVTAAAQLADGSIATVGPDGLTVLSLDDNSRLNSRFDAEPVAVTAHGKGVAVAMNGEIVVVEIGAGARSMPVPAVPTVLTSVAGRVVAGSASGIVTVVPPSGDVHTLVGHGAPITALSQVGKDLLTADAGGVVRRWDIASGQPLSVFHHRAPVRHVRGLSLGQVVSADDSGHIVWWDSGSGESLRVQRPHDGTVTALVAGDSTVVRSAGRDGQVWFRTRFDDTLQVDVGAAVLLLAQLDSSTIVTWDERRMLTWWDSDGVRLGHVQPQEDCPAASALFTDRASGLTILVHANGLVAYPRPTASDDASDAPFLRALAAADNGEIAVGTADSTLRISDGHQFTSQPGLPIGLGYVGTERRLFTATDEGVLRVHPGARARGLEFPGEPPARLVATVGPSAAAVFADGRARVMMTGPDADSGFTLPVEDATALAMVGDAGLAVGTASGLLTVAEPGSPPRTARIGQTAVTALVEAGTYGMVAGTVDGRMLRWDPPEGTITSLGTHDGPVTGIAAIGGGRVAVSSSADGTLRAWDLELGTEWAIVSGPAPFHAVATPRGASWVVARSGHATVWRLDVARPEEDGLDWLFEPPSRAAVISRRAHGDGVPFVLTAAVHCEVRAVRQGAVAVPVAFDWAGTVLEPTTSEGALVTPRRLLPGSRCTVHVALGDARLVQATVTVVTPTLRRQTAVSIRFETNV